MTTLLGFSASFLQAQMVARVEDAMLQTAIALPKTTEVGVESALDVMVLFARSLASNSLCEVDHGSIRRL